MASGKLFKNMLEVKKIKEVKDYAKSDVKHWLKETREAKKRGKETEAEVKKRYPEGITSYYAEIVARDLSRSERLKAQFGYTDETLKERAEIYHEAFWSSWSWWQAQIVKDEKVMAKYSKIFKEAEAVAKKVDVSDIQDGFPCGMAVLYLKAEGQDTDLGKVIKRLNDSDGGDVWAYKLPIKMPSYGQCMRFDERVCERVASFLSSKGIEAGVYSMID